MFKKTKSLKEYTHRAKDEQCHCNDNNKSYKILENYRSILDRKQSLISSWKIFEQNGKISFTRGTHFRKGTDALAIQSDHSCLIHPWYKYIDVQQHSLAILNQNQCYKVFETVLLECNCLTNSHEYELAIIECPCLEQTRTYCAYCRLTLTATEQGNILLPTAMLKNVSQQTNISFPLEFFNNAMNIDDSFYSQSGSYQHQRSVQIQVESEEVRHAINEHEKNLLTRGKLTNVPELPLIIQAFDEDPDNSLSETKSIALLQNDDIQQQSSQSNTESRSSNRSISLRHFLSPQHSSNEDSLSDQNTFEGLTQSITRGTQTKLFAILLPQSPLSEMIRAKTVVRTLRNVTRICQVNTLSYLIKTNGSQTEVQYSGEDIQDAQQMDPSSTTSFLYNKTQSMKDLLSEAQAFNIESSRETRHQTVTDRKQYDQEMNVPTIEFEGDELIDNLEEKMNSISTNKEIIPINEQSQDFIFTLSPLKCVNTCDAIDLDELSAPVASTFFDNGTTATWISPDKQFKLFNQPSSNSNIHLIKSSNNNNERVTSDQRNHSLASTDHVPSNSSETSKLFRLKMKYYRTIFRKRRQNKNKKLAYGFLQRLQRRKKRNIPQLHLSQNHSPLYSTDDCDRLPTTQSNTIKHNKCLNQPQQSIINLHLDTSDVAYQYPLHDYTIVARASKNSSACKQLQTLLNNPDTSIEELIDTQVRLTCNENYRSVCILIDDHKQSEDYRSSFLRYIYKTLSNTLKTISDNNSTELKCMNLVYFQNSFCDIIKMQRLRLIDTGKQILLLPSCEISLNTSDDINIALNRLSTKMLFAHQIFIINFSHNHSSSSGSFLFLQLAPICSIRPTGLLTNLNSTTYSILNLIRQLFKHNIVKRYLLNDCSLNRLLKSYLFSSKQTMTVITVKPKISQ